MINLRYHVVSITAVFLALGIGLVFGAAFIDRATVDALNRNLTDIEAQNDELEATNADLSGRIDEAQEIEQGLRDEGPGQLLAGRLDAVPVLVLAAAGVGDEAVDALQAAVEAAGATTAGVLVVTERFALDGEAEVGDLRTVLGLPGAGADQLRTAAVRQVRTLLVAATRATPEPSVERVPVPPLLNALIGAGFLELRPSAAPPEDFDLIPAAGLRLVVVSGSGADVVDDAFIMPLVELLLQVRPTEAEGSGRVLVAAQVGERNDEADSALLPLVTRIRDDEELRGGLSTVDHASTFAGVAATILALDHGAEGQLGHYGSDDDAQSLLPPALTAGAPGG
jgi:hypothetical protein